MYKSASPHPPSFHGVCDSTTTLSCYYQTKLNLPRPFVSHMPYGICHMPMSFRSVGGGGGRYNTPPRILGRCLHCLIAKDADAERHDHVAYISDLLG